ncbi:MAG: hypothetical protein N2556_06270 [Anaerolineae bacterium]|nr:hypothetical protein [Anaerolineae bacterium]
MDTLHLVFGLTGVILLLVFIRRAVRKTAGFLIAFAGLTVALVFGYTLVAQATATRQVAQVAQVQAATSAGVTIVLALLLFLVVLLGVVGALAAGWLWWKERQRRQRMLEFLWLNQVYGFTTGIPRSAPHLQGAQSSGPVIILPTYPPFVQGSPYVPPETPVQWQEFDLAGLLPE